MEVAGGPISGEAEKGCPPRMATANSILEPRASEIGHSMKVNNVSHSTAFRPRWLGKESNRSGIMRVAHCGLHPFDQRWNNMQVIPENQINISGRRRSGLRKSHT